MIVKNNNNLNLPQLKIILVNINIKKLYKSY